MNQTEQLIYIVKRPIISEKSTVSAENLNAYSFEVAPTANRKQVKEAVEKLFNVKVKNVRTMIMHGKVKRSARALYKRTNWKKAIVTLNEGQKIQFYQGV